MDWPTEGPLLTAPFRLAKAAILTLFGRLIVRLRLDEAIDYYLGSEPLPPNQFTRWDRWGISTFDAHCESIIRAMADEAEPDPTTPPGIIRLLTTMSHEQYRQLADLYIKEWWGARHVVLVGDEMGLLWPLFLKHPHIERWTEKARSTARLRVIGFYPPDMGHQLLDVPPEEAVAAGMAAAEALVAILSPTMPRFVRGAWWSVWGRYWKKKLPPVQSEWATIDDYGDVSAVVTERPVTITPQQLAAWIRKGCLLMPRMTQWNDNFGFQDDEWVRKYGPDATSDAFNYLPDPTTARLVSAGVVGAAYLGRLGAVPELKDYKAILVNDFIDWFLKEGLFEREYIRPSDGKIDSLWGIIAALVNGERWSREQVADWLETLELPQPVETT